MGLANLGMLFGLAGLAIPVLVHLLRRRRHEIVRWGAMQFLPASMLVRRRRFWDELPLLALRMLLVAVLVIGLAGPYAASAVLAPLAERSPRDIVLVLDGSYSMARRDAQGGTPWAEACHRAAERVAGLGHGERAALLVACRPPLIAQPELTADRALLQARLDALPAPRGVAGLPQTVAAACRLLQTQGEAAEREVVILTDRQHFGWADDATRREWETVGRLLQEEMGDRLPRVTVVDVAGRVAPLPNAALGPLVATRGLVPVGHAVKLTTLLHPAEGARPRGLRVLVDGVLSQQVPLPETVSGPMPLSFTARFDRPGRHVVTAVLDWGERPDALAVDNEQHAVIEVATELPVLLVDGDDRPGPESSTFFLDKALAGPERRSVIVSRVVPWRTLAAADVLGTATMSRPRVVMLADVPDLAAPVRQALSTFVQDGGGVLLAVGPRVERAGGAWLRDGAAWLPGRLLAVERGTARPAAATFQGAALERFPKGLGEVAFSHWWRTDGGTVLARLDGGAPWLSEKAYGKGRTLLCSVPLDRSWDSPLPAAWEFPVLVHELIYDLAGAQSRSWRLDAAQPLQIGPGPSAAPGRLIVETPDGPGRTVEVRHWPWSEADTGAVGVYRVERDDGRREVFVVPPDLRESDERRCTDAAWVDVLRSLPSAGTSEAASDTAWPVELWWLALLAALALACGEVALTRRLAVVRGTASRR